MKQPEQLSKSMRAFHSYNRQAGKIRAYKSRPERRFPAATPQNSATFASVEARLQDLFKENERPDIPVDLLKDWDAIGQPEMMIEVYYNPIHWTLFSFPGDHVEFEFDAMSTARKIKCE